MMHIFMAIFLLFAADPALSSRNFADDTSSSEEGLKLLSAGCCCDQVVDCCCGPSTYCTNCFDNSSFLFTQTFSCSYPCFPFGWQYCFCGASTLLCLNGLTFAGLTAAHMIHLEIGIPVAVSSELLAGCIYFHTQAAYDLKDNFYPSLLSMER